MGISALYHDSACSLIRDGNLVAAAQEERFSRIKNDPSIPKKAFRFCLKQSGLSVKDIECLAYYEMPEKKLARQVWSGVLPSSDGLTLPDPSGVEDDLRFRLGYDGPILYFEHHHSHAASSYYFSGFEEAAILTVDGVGEWATTTYGHGSRSKIDIFEEVHFPDSLGLLYSTITSFLGFSVNSGEYKVMGLAPYGTPQYVQEIRELIVTDAGGGYHLKMEYFDFVRGQRMFSDALFQLFGSLPREEGAEIRQFHKDVAKSLQVVLEEILLEKAYYLFERTGSRNLCLAGGVALNCVANGKLLRRGPFSKIFIQPAANDAGCSLGAAALGYLAVQGSWETGTQLDNVYVGPEYSAGEIGRLLRSTSLRFADHTGQPDALVAAAAEQLAQGKVGGWFQGRMEFGPRSLGARSILGDPRDENMRDRINAMVKKREAFRPFAPAVLEEDMGAHFEMDQPSPFMLTTCQVRSPLYLPAITHVDGSARVQTVNTRQNSRFHALLAAFKKITGCPILLNTSFNIKDEPIVCSPEDALQCFITTNIDFLVLGDFLIQKEGNAFKTLEMILQSLVKTGPGIRHDVYTFI
jgi:carbamoyltransferase